MRAAGLGLALACLATISFAQERAGEGPTNEKAQKAYKDGMEYLRHRNTDSALDRFKKADKEDGGHCLACQKQIIHYGAELHDWKAAESAAEEMVAQAQGQRDTAVAHYEFGMVLLNEALSKHKDELFSRSHEEMTKALAAVPKFPAAVFEDGRVLAYLKQDEAAKAHFEQFVQMSPEESVNRQRALLYIKQPELVRALMAPPFAVTTLDGKRLSLDDLQGKVVLIDFWATWCTPCRAEIPHFVEMQQKYGPQGFQVVGISMDDDAKPVKEFYRQFNMNYPVAVGDDKLAQSFGGVLGLPVNFIIDREGRIHAKYLGATDVSVIDKAVSALLANP